MREHRNDETYAYDGIKADAWCGAMIILRTMLGFNLYTWPINEDKYFQRFFSLNNDGENNIRRILEMQNIKPLIMAALNENENMNSNIPDYVIELIEGHKIKKFMISDDLIDLLNLLLKTNANERYVIDEKIINHRCFVGCGN